MKLKLSELTNNLRGQKMFQILAKANKLESEGKSILHFELGDPDFETPEPIIITAINSLSNGRTHYESSFGTLELRQKAAEVTERSRGFLPKLNQLLVTPGANFQIYLALACVANPGDEIIIPDPGFVSYLSIISCLGLKAVSLEIKEEDNFETKCANIKKLITKNTKAIILNNPSNPTGGVTNEVELRNIYKLLKNKNIWIISDEIYSRITYKSKTPFFSITSLDKCEERCILINGFSKAYAMTGWRIGVVTAPEYLVNKMNLLLETLISCIPSFIQDAAVTALSIEPQYWITMIEEYQKRRNLIVSGLNEIKGFTCNLPQGAFYAFPNITGVGVSDEEICDLLLNKCGVATVPGSYFGENGKNNIRFSYVSSEEKISLAIKRMKNYFGKH